MNPESSAKMLSLKTLRTAVSGDGNQTERVEEVSYIQCHLRAACVWHAQLTTGKLPYVQNSCAGPKSKLGFAYECRSI